MLALHDAGARTRGVLGVDDAAAARRRRRASPSRRVVLALDAVDAAGDAAAAAFVRRRLPTLVDESGVDVVVMRWPDGAKDAADLWRAASSW